MKKAGGLPTLSEAEERHFVDVLLAASGSGKTYSDRSGRKVLKFPNNTLSSDWALNFVSSADDVATPTSVGGSGATDARPGDRRRNVSGNSLKNYLHSSVRSGNPFWEWEWWGGERVVFGCEFCFWGYKQCLGFVEATGENVLLAGWN
ncbi:hypothetical protein JTB14_000955 [Gonioctena quinquepunctata]|nr:hypothetical protein JTB14_000955 [Gonioctena quinquepunctata]